MARKAAAIVEMDEIFVASSFLPALGYDRAEATTERRVIGPAVSQIQKELTDRTVIQGRKIHNPRNIPMPMECGVG